jgi:hypothetical protein
MFPALLFAMWTASQPSTSGTMVRGYVQAIPLLTIVPASDGSYHRVSPNLSGTAPALSLSAGARITDRVSIEGDFVWSGSVSAPQRFSYFWSIDYRANNRDNLLNGAVRIKAHRLELVGGGGVAFSRAVKDRQIEIRYDPILRRDERRPLPDNIENVRGWTVTAGADVPLVVHRHLALVPSFRFRWVERPEPATFGWVGSGTYVYQVGLGVRPVW